MFWQGSKSSIDTPLVILSFDIASEVFNVISFPDSVRFGRCYYGTKLAVHDGKLAIIYFDKTKFTFYEEDDISLYFLVMGRELLVHLGSDGVQVEHILAT